MRLALRQNSEVVPVVAHTQKPMYAPPKYCWIPPQPAITLTVMSPTLTSAEDHPHIRRQIRSPETGFWDVWICTWPCNGLLVHVTTGNSRAESYIRKSYRVAKKFTTGTEITEKRTFIGAGGNRSPSLVNSDFFSVCSPRPLRAQW
jgi:hypothetical protein